MFPVLSEAIQNHNTWSLLAQVGNSGYKLRHSEDEDERMAAQTPILNLVATRSQKRKDAQRVRKGLV